MTIMRGRTDWREAGACAHDDPDLYFPISSTGSALRQIAKAKATCAGCPVRQACLEFALEHDLIHGIWGGTTPEDRQAWRHERRSGRLRAATRRASLNPSADVRKIFMPNGCGFLNPGRADNQRGIGTLAGVVICQGAAVVMSGLRT